MDFTTTAAIIPPISPYGTLQGSLFQYKTFPSLVAFESSPPPVPSSPTTDTISTSPLAENKCILLGGLSDGLLPTPYTKDLEKVCFELGWSLVQPIISSSYTGFGHGSLERDTEEICSLMKYLKHHRSAKNFALVGHSTGCQNSIHFTKHGEKDLVSRTKVIALQAPVSDREGAMQQPNYTENIEHARNLAMKGRGEEMMPRDTFWAPITASRFLSLQDKDGDDDFFSSDLTDEELITRLGHVGRCGVDHGLRALVAFSGEDEYVPDHVDKAMLLARMCCAMNHRCEDGKDAATPLILKDGNHNLSKEEGNKEKFVDAVKELLKSVE